MNAYKNVMQQIQASTEFKSNMQKKMMQDEPKEKRFFMKHIKIVAGSLVSCATIVIAVITNMNQESTFDLTERIVVDTTAPAASMLVNIEGYITEVGADGLSFTLDNGMRVVVTEQTELGIDGPTAAPKEEQLFEPTFRVGNLIGGFAENLSTQPISAAVIYTNWNFDDPIR